MDGRGGRIAGPGPGPRSRRETSWTLALDGIEIAVTAKAVKHMRLVVHPDGRVRASVPLRTTRAQAESFIRPRIGWVRRQLQRRRLPQAIVDGGSLPLWGELLTVKLTRGRTGARPLSVDHVNIAVADPDDEEAVKLAVEALYRREVRAVLPDMIEKWAAELGRRPTRVTIRAMTTRWGSCTTTTGAIRINPDLAARHPRYLSYVVLHEMVHLTEPSHGKGFQAKMDVHLPKWRQIRKELNNRK